MKIQLSGIVNDSIVDGEGIRMTIFTQGCPHHCPDCHNPQTHSFMGGYEADTDKILSMMSENPLLDGITLSGGEPMQQPEACYILAEGAKKLNLNVWVYTGYTWEKKKKKNNPSIQKLLQKTDILIDGRFIASLRSLELAFKGSSNQRTIDVQKSLLQNHIILYKKNVN